MRIFKAIAIVAAGAILGCTSLHAQHVAGGSAPDHASSLMDGTTAAPPPGFVAFCIHNPALCMRSSAAALPTVRLDDAARATLLSINSRINNEISYETDEQHYGVANLWTLDVVGGHGDCKDYALAKRQALIAAGFPESALRIAIVKTRESELHAVLTVDTDHGDFVLDNLTPAIKLWTQTQYSWLSRQSADDPLRWVHLAQYRSGD